jgi:hypothetical protein
MKQDITARKAPPHVSHDGAPPAGTLPRPALVTETARRVLRIEAEAILQLAETLPEDFIAAVEMLMACKGRVILSGQAHSVRMVDAHKAGHFFPWLFLGREGLHPGQCEANAGVLKEIPSFHEGWPIRHCLFPG